MTRAKTRGELALPVVLLLTGVCALLPAAWQRPWTSDVAEVVRFPLRPFTHAGSALAGWLRPPKPLSADLPDDPGLVDRLVEERELAESLYQRERLRTLELEEQIRQLELIPRQTLRYASARFIAHVTRRSAPQPLGMVEIKLERGAADRIAAGTVAVYGGVHVLGRTTSESIDGVCLLQPLAHRSTGYLRARVFPREDPAGPIERTALVQLEPTGGGVLEAAVSQDAVVREGDVVRLDDPGWPPVAQMLVVGRVESVRVDDREPLRNVITVRPRYEPARVAYVTLIVEQAEPPGSAP